MLEKRLFIKTLSSFESTKSCCCSKRHRKENVIVSSLQHTSFYTVQQFWWIQECLDLSNGLILCRWVWDVRSVETVWFCHWSPLISQEFVNKQNKNLNDDDTIKYYPSKSSPPLSAGSLIVFNDKHSYRRRSEWWRSLNWTQLEMVQWVLSRARKY